MTMFDKADRLRKLPPYLFKEIDRRKSELRAKGVDLIDLGIGDPDLPTPAHIIEAMKKAVGDSANHRYPSYSGMLEFRAAVSEWYRKRFGVDLDPEKRFSPHRERKDCLLALAFINPGDVSLVPSPGYPVQHRDLFARRATPCP
jgi:LL-diaminopimelate aminotransferase